MWRVRLSLSVARAHLPFAILLTILRCQSPNGTIRNILGGTVFREPIIVEKVPKAVPGWTKPIIVGRHAHGDQYRATDIVVPGPGKLELIYTPDDKAQKVVNQEVYHFKGPGVGLAMYNTKQSIVDFAQSSFKLAIEKKLPLVSCFLSTLSCLIHLSRRWLIAVSVDRSVHVDQKHHPQGLRRTMEGHLPRDLRHAVRCQVQGARHLVRAPIDRRCEFARPWLDLICQCLILSLLPTRLAVSQMVAQMIKSSGGYIMALKNYDGDVQSDIVA